jgi:hypothetical protein
MKTSELKFSVDNVDYVYKFVHTDGLWQCVKYTTQSLVDVLHLFTKKLTEDEMAALLKSPFRVK